MHGQQPANTHTALHRRASKLCCCGPSSCAFPEYDYRPHSARDPGSAHPQQWPHSRTTQAGRDRQDVAVFDRRLPSLRYLPWLTFSTIAPKRSSLGMEVVHRSSRMSRMKTCPKKEKRKGRARLRVGVSGDMPAGAHSTATACHSGITHDVDVKECSGWCKITEKTEHCLWCKCAPSALHTPAAAPTHLTGHHPHHTLPIPLPLPSSAPSLSQNRVLHVCARQVPVLHVLPSRRVDQSRVRKRWDGDGCLRSRRESSIPATRGGLRALSDAGTVQGGVRRCCASVPLFQLQLRDRGVPASRNLWRAQALLHEAQLVDLLARRGTQAELCRVVHSARTPRRRGRDHGERETGATCAGSGAASR